MFLYLPFTISMCRRLQYRLPLLRRLLQWIAINFSNLISFPVGFGQKGPFYWGLIFAELDQLSFLRACLLIAESLDLCALVMVQASHGFNPLKLLRFRLEWNLVNTLIPFEELLVEITTFSDSVSFSLLHLEVADLQVGQSLGSIPLGRIL